MVSREKEPLLPESMHGVIEMVYLVGTLSIACLVIQTSFLPEADSSTGLSSIVAIATRPGAADRGRAVFNGKGVCYYCHGVDGYLDRRPQLEADTAALIAQLNPKPADLRNPKSLRLTTDKARTKAIREGHPGTGMFPYTRMTDQELANTIAYLSSLRREGSLKGPSQ
jgi:mono/diheme cytochrome c family protein